MHHKHHHLIIATYALLVLAAPLIWTNGAHAQVASCPTGYTCTPIQQVSNCPTGFYCTPTTGTANTSGVFSNGYYWDSNAYTNSGSTYVTPTSSQTGAQAQTQAVASSCYLFDANLGVGSTGKAVNALQALLAQKGYAVSVSGTFDYQTANAVSQYQAAVGIPATGFVGPITRAHLNVDCGSNTNTPVPTLNPNLSVNAAYQGMNASGPVYIFSASIVNQNVAYIRITLSCPANVSAVMKVSGDCNDDGALMSGQNVSWNGLLLNHTSSYQTIVVTAKAISASGTVIATAQTQVSIAPSPDWQGNSNQNPAPVSVSYPTAGMTFTAGTPISIAFLNPVLGTTYRIQLRGKAYSADLGTTYVGIATDQQKAIFLLPTNIPADAAPFSIVIMVGNTDVAYSPSIAIVSTTGTPGVNPSTGTLSASCSGAPSGKDSYDLTWTAQVTGGTAPYSYSWSVYNDVSSYISGSTQSASFSDVYSTAGTKQAIARISDSSGVVVTASCSAATVPTQVSTAPVSPAPQSGPSTTLLISLRAIKLGELVTLLSNTTSPSSSLKSAAIDMSTDNANWTSGAPCGYWNSSTGTDSVHAITCNFTPVAAGTYYFRSRGTDSVGASGFVYQTLVVGTE